MLFLENISEMSTTNYVSTMSKGQVVYTYLWSGVIEEEYS